MDMGWFCQRCGEDKRLSIQGKPNWQVKQRELCAGCWVDAKSEGGKKGGPIGGKTRKGKPSGNKGKTWQATDEFRDKHRQIFVVSNPMKNAEVVQKAVATKRANGFYAKISAEMSNGKAVWMNSLNQNPSKPQVALFNVVQSMFPEAVLNYPVYREGKGKRNYSIDIAIPERGIAIEYDGYYHFHEQKRTGMDDKRQKDLEGIGWNFIRYNIFQKFPTKEQVLADIGCLTNSGTPALTLYG